MALPTDIHVDSLPTETPGPGGRNTAFSSTWRAAQGVPDLGQCEGQDIPLVRPSSCIVKGGIPSSERYLPKLGVITGGAGPGG